MGFPLSLNFFHPLAASKTKPIQRRRGKEKPKWSDGAQEPRLTWLTGVIQAFMQVQPLVCEPERASERHP